MKDLPKSFLINSPATDSA